MNPEDQIVPTPVDENKVPEAAPVEFTPEAPVAPDSTSSPQAEAAADKPAEEAPLA